MEFAPTTRNAFANASASSYNVASLAPADHKPHTLRPWWMSSSRASSRGPRSRTTPSRTMSTITSPPNECKNSKKKQQNTSNDFEAQAYKSHPRRRSCPSRTAAQKRRRHQIRDRKEECQPYSPCSPVKIPRKSDVVSSEGTPRRATSR